MAARAKNRGLVFLRRSSGKQETSLETQLAWAIGEAAKHGVILDASIDDLAHMQANKLHSYKAILLDDSITGADLDRPGLRTLIERANRDPSVSHAFAHKRDRLGRPEEPISMMAIEIGLTINGITLVLSDGIAHPSERGQTNLTHLVEMLFGYHTSGEFLKSLAERVINAQQLLARQGFRTGGNAPYEFARVLVGADGRVVEELAPGRTVRQPGCHVRIVPKDLAKIKVWIYILDLKFQGWGITRIARHLTELGIPSPDAGRVRTDHGAKHRVSGKWCANTVADLCRNRAILGIQDYGRRSEGAHRRIGEAGPRILNDEDRTESGRPRFIANDSSLIVSGPNGQAQYDTDRWRAIQSQMDRRAGNQRGIARSKDPGKYPLSCRVVDLTDGCGAVMVGLTSGKRRLYKCGEYIRSAGIACHHNLVDAEAMLGFTLKTIRQIIDRAGGRKELRKLLEERAVRGASPTDCKTSAEMIALTQRISDLRADLETIQRRMAVERDDRRYQAIATEFDALTAQLLTAEAKAQEQHKESADISADPTTAVAGSLALLDEIERVTGNCQARAKVNPLLIRLGVRIGLYFADAVKGKKRKVRRLVGGVMTLGDASLPVQLHGSRGLDPNPIASNEQGNRTGQPLELENGRKNFAGRCDSESVKTSTHMPALPDVRPVFGHRKVSLSMVNRGDKI